MSPDKGSKKSECQEDDCYCIGCNLFYPLGWTLASVFVLRLVPQSIRKAKEKKLSFEN